MSSTTIHLVAHADLGAAAALFEAQLHEHGVPASAHDLQPVVATVTSDPRHGFMLVARVDGRAVGVIYVAMLLSLEHAGTIGWLEELYVLPEFRGAGLGSRLVGESVSRAASLGWKGVELEIMDGHERVAGLYLRHGFEPLSRSRFCHIFGPDSVF